MDPEPGRQVLPSIALLTPAPPLAPSAYAAAAAAGSAATLPPGSRGHHHAPSRSNSRSFQSLPQSFDHADKVGAAVLQPLERKREGWEGRVRRAQVLSRPEALDAP